MGFKTVPHPSYRANLAPCDFWLSPALRGCRYETIEEMKDAVTKVIHTLTQEDYRGVFQKLLERYNKCIASGIDYFEGGLEFHECTINKSAHTKKCLETYSMILVSTWILIETWKNIEYESDGDTNCYRCARYSYQRIGKRTAIIRYKNSSGDHRKDGTVMIGQNTEKSTV